MATRKAGGTAKNLSDSQPKYLGTKLYAGEKAQPGSVIVRQRGTKIMPGKNVGVGVDHTLFSKAAGTVQFRTIRKTDFTGVTSRRKVVDVVSK